MSKTKKTKSTCSQLHLTMEDREQIQEGLNQNLRLKEIAQGLKKDPCTISKEIKRHRIKKQANVFNNWFKD